MALDNGKLRQIYTTLQKGGYNNDYNTFVSVFSGNNNYPNRKYIYDLLTAHGEKVGSSYEEFMSFMQQPKQQPKKQQQPKQQQQARPAARQNPGHTAQSMPWGEGLGALSKEEGNKKVVENAVDKWNFSRMVSQAKPKPQPKPQPQRSYVSQLTPTMNTIYDILKDAGEKVGSVQQFQSYFERGYGHRKAIYDKLVKLGAFDGSYNEFAEVVGLKPKNALTNKMSFKRNANNYQINKEVREEATLNAVKDNDYISAGNAMLDSTPTQADEIDSDELQNSVYNTLNDALLSEQRTDLRQKGVGFTNSNIDNGRAQLKQDGFDPVINSQIKYMGKVYDRLNNKYLPVYQTTDGKQYHEALTADKAQRYIDVTSMPYREIELRRRKQELEDAINKRGSEIDRATPTGYALGGVAAMGLGSAATPNNAGFSRLQDTDYLTLQANLKEVDEALGEIEEAKRGLASDKWIANSNGDFERFGKRLFGYFGGSYRGFMHSIGKVSTWDFGLSDIEAAMGVARAVRKADKVGFENLSKEQQKLLNDAAQHMMISQEYAHLIGRGYKAGQVTAESLPFMLEMIVNPASSMGKAAQQKVVRSLIKKFGKDAIRKSAQKYLLKKYGARVVGDALGASVMASTTGSGRVYADTRRRMTGDLNYNVNESGEAYYDGHEKGESFVKAFAKAFGAQAIENHSEMLGEYIKPLLGVVGKTAYKGLTKATAKNLYTRFGVNKVRGMINDVMSTPFAQFVSDLESRAKWNGMLGEYAEEVIGNVENALLVGDNTLDADENTGVFDLDQNIDTFLGVSLMGGFVSSVKTGYYLLRGKKRLTLNEMNKAGRAIDSAFSGNIQLMNTWGGWRNTILLGTDEEKKSVLREILDNKSIPMNVRMRILDYAKSAQEYQGIVKAQEIRRYSSDEASVLSERIDISADEGYEATNEQKNAIRRAYRRAKKKFDSVFGEQAKELLALDENELFMLTDEMTTKKANAIYDYLDSKSRYEGMLYAVQDKVNDAVDDSNKSIDERTHTDGTLIKATMNVDDRQVYIVNGNIVLRDDGSIDMNNSDKSIVIVDAETNKREMVAPSAFKSVDTPVSAEEVKAKAAQEVTEQITREESDIIDGKLDFNVGDTYDVVDQNENQFSVQIIEDKGDNVVVQINGQQTEMAKADVQKMYDDYVQLQDEAEDNKDGNAEAQEESQTANELKEGSRVSINGVEYTIAEISDNNVTLVDSNGKRIPWSKSALDAKLKSGDAEVLKPMADVKVGDVYMDNDGDSFTITRIEDNNVYVADSKGVEYEEPYEISVFTDMINAGMLTRKENEHASEAEDNASSEDEDNASSEGMSPASDEGQNNESDTPISPTEDATPATSEPQNESMPMKTVGKGKNARQQEDWLSTTPKRGYDYLFNEVGLKREEAKGVLDAYLAEAQKKLDAERKKEVKFIANVQAYKEKKIAREKRITELQAEVDYWKSVKDEYMKVLLEEKRERDAKDAADHDQAVEDELKRKEDEARKKAEAEARGSNAVSAEIRDKWNEANKIVGAEDEVTLPNGETITGHYILVESGAATPSHQSTNGFEETEGFPVDQDGKNVNDRDYKRDKEAQQITLRMGENYDQRAIQSPIVVSQDGVVLSGNGRTMAGEIAAQNGTDIKYNDYLRKYGNKYGFTQEQIAAYQHPRVVFVPDVAMPYNSETFAKFNQREQKSQNRTETAVKMGKLVSDDLFGRVMSKVNEFSTLGEFYANDKATTEVIKELAAAGVIPQTEMAGLFDGGKLSEVGQGIVEGVMIGKAFQANPDAVRQITEIKSMRQAVMTALQDVAINNRLGNGYDLSNELAAAIDLVYKARKAGFQLGQHVSQYAHQGNLFQLDDGATVADFNNAAVMMLADVLNDKRVTILKQVISSYNAQAENSSQGIGDLLSGGAIRSKEEIINEINQLYNNGQEYNRTAETASDRQGRGSQGSEQGTVDSESNSAGKTRELANEFDALATELNTAEGEERMRVLGEMRDCIAHFAEENGYPVPEFLLTREDFLAAVPEKDRAKVEQWLDDGWHCPAYYEKGKVYYFVEGCDNFDKDVSETLSHEYTHADNAEYPENVNALTYAVEDTHEVSQDELIDILETLSNSSHYEEKAERLESEGKNSNPMLADEVIAHVVSLMVVNGEQTLDSITKNPTLQFIIKRAYKVRENERRHNILASETSERSSNTSKSSETNSRNSQSVAEGESKLGRYGRSTRSESNSGRTEGSADRGQSGIADSKQSVEKGGVTEEGTPLSSKIEAASAKVNTEPTEAQKEAGNYKKGHVQVGTFDITIEQPQGSVRKGMDADGKHWESKMNNTYGYIRGAVGVDGDHIDVFLSNDIDGWNGRKVFVVDQYNPDGSFDEHKVMLGFNDADEAKSDYLANYENGWEDGRRIDVSAVNLEDFEKWIASSKRKTKPFGEYSLVKKTDNQGNPLNADGTLKLEKVKSVDDLTDEDFSKPTRSVELPHVPENVDNALGADGKPVIIKKNIFEKNWEAHKFPFAESRSILKSALYNTDLIGQTQPTKRPLHWVAIKLDEKSPIVVLEVNENKDNVEIVGWYTLDGRNLERIKRQAEKNGGELVMLSPKDKVESLSTPQSDLSSDGKGKEKVSSKQGSVGRKNVYGKNKVADWRTSVPSAMRLYETSPHDAHVAMCDIIDGMDSNALYGLMRMVLRTITSLDNENIRDGWKVDATHDLFDILKDRGFVVTKGSKGVAIGDVVIDKRGIIYVVEGVGKSRLDCGLYEVNDKTIIDHMTISRASVKYYYRDVNGKKDSVRSQKADVVDAELMAEEKPFNAVIEMLRKKFPDASMEALTAADRLLREQALPGERQKAIEAVAKALGLKVEWRDTMEKENGTFNPKTRTITIARDSEHALANTFGHEVTHAVRNLSEADYKNLKDAVRRLYSSEKEYNEAVQAYGEVYTGLDFDALEEELIADNIGFMIGGRNDMTQELASRMNHRVLWAIHDAMNKVRNALAKVLHIDSKKNGLLEAIDSAKATIRETMANAQRIAKEKGQGLSNESGSARQSLRTQDTPLLDVDGKPIVVKTDDGKVELNLRTWQDEKQQVRDALLDGGLEPEAVDAMMAQAETIASGMSGLLDKYPLFGAWQKVAATNRPILRNNNGGYLSFDYSFNCVKKDALNAVMEALVADGKGSHLGVTQVEALKKVLQKHGFLTPCVMCYVEAKRKVYKQSKEMAAKWNAVAETVGLNGEEMGAERELGAEQRHALEQLANGENLGSVKGFAAQGGDGIKKDTIVKIAKLMLNSAKLRGRMNYEWLMSPNSYTEMYNKFGDTGLMEFISQGQSRGKALLEASPFSFKSIPSDLMTGMYNPVALANLGGVRQFSYEDARAVMFFDYYTQFLVMQGARAPEHLYTKRPFMPEMFGRTGAMMNQSLIVDIWRGEEWHKKALGLSDKDYDAWLTAHAGFVPRGALPKGHTLYEVGSTELVPNWGVESFPVDIAMKNVHNKDYKGTVGNVVVAPNREFILWALDNPDIHMVLAYHASGANPLMKSLTGYDRAEAMDDGYHTYDKNGKVVSELSVPGTGLEIHGGALQWNVLLRRNGYDARKAAQVYLDYCKEHGLTPMFCYDGVVDMSGERATSHPEYYKLLTDFRVYDEDGNSIRQRAVKAVLPENWQVILDKYLQQESSLSGKVGNIRLDEGLMNEINAVTRFASIESGERDTLTKLLTSIYGKGNVQVLATREFDAALDDVTDRGHAQMLRDNGGTVYGFAVGDRIVLNEDLFNANTPMHEHTHVYMKVLKATNPRLYNRGMELWRDTPLWNQAKRGLEALGEEPTDDRIFSECMSQFTGAENEKIISEVTGITDKNWLQKAMSWLSEMWKGVKSAFARWTQKDLDGLTAEQFGRMPLRAVYDAKERKAYTERVEQVFGDGGARVHDVVTKREAPTKPSAGPREAERMEIKQSLRDGTFIQSGSYFSGGGLLEEGLKNYLDPKVAVEFNSKISGVYADNHGRHIVTADVRDVDPATLVGQLDSPVEYFHASPVCKNFSRAKREAGEVELDKETARSTADFIKANHPKVVTIENVKGYRDSEALKIITDELSRQGYDWDMDVYNAADFGGYTSRERLIVRAVRDCELPPKPKAIAKEDRKKGWMEAVSDLIPTLHEKRSGVPEWMDSRLKAEGIDWHNIDKPLYVFGQGNNRNSVPHAFADELLPTLRTKGGDVIIMPDGRVLRAEPRVLARVTGLSDDYRMPITDDLAHTIVGNGIPAQLSQGVIGPLLEGVFNGGERVTEDNRQGDDKNMKFSHRIDGGIANKTVSNVIISSEDKVPQTRDEALSLLSTLEQPFKNKDQGVDIYVSKRDARHSMSFRNIDQIKAMSKIDKIAEEAVKIGEVPVEDDEKETTKAISIYYCPVNVAGKQYSARLTVKTYFEGSNVIDEMHLYNYQLRNMAPFAQSVSQQVLPTHPNGTISEYKVSDLIHDTQQNDLKMVGLENDSEKQSRRGTPNLYPDHIAQAIYEQSVNGFKFDLDEAWHDSLLSVKRLQEAISETRGVPIRDFENAYWHAVTLSSVNAAEMEQLMNLRIQPFIEAVQDICKKHDLTQEDIEVYLNCKHGLERNEAMARRDAEKQANEEFKDELRKAERAAAKDPLDQDAADALDDVKQRMNDREEELYLKNREKDYSGLTDIFDPKDKVTGDRLDLTVSELEDKAKKCVDDFENKVGVADVTKLWDNIHELNNYSLRKSYLSGLISKSQYDSVKQMYQWYVPLRGFNEEVAGDVYTYVTRGETRTQQLLKEAKGRTSRAGDILATMMNMANSAVNQGNRNLMKQKILNLALNAKSPLLSVSSTWYQTDANGFDVPIEPPINDQMTPSEQKDSIEQWEDTMEMQAKQGKVHRMSDNLRLNLRTQKWQADEHCIRVQRGGKEYCVWVNGNPRAAQALNDRLGNQVTKPYKATETILDKAEDLFTDGFMKIFRYMAQSVTSLNPEFVISNFQRDLASASLISTGKYGVGYTKDFLVNVKRLGVLTGTMSHKKEYRNAAGIYTLYSKYKSGNLDNNNEMERYFAEFMQHGGETGYTQSLSIKDYQSRIQSALGDKGFVKWSKNAGHAVADFVEMANRGVENTCRFAAYMTSRQHGKSVLQAIVDAKEASTNFNLHGAGGFGNAWLRKSIIFINPAVQSIVQYCQLTAKHPKAMLSMLGGTILLGAAMAFACARMVAPGGGDPDSNYWDLSDYVRHNYIVIPSGNGNWTRIALPPEIRAVYGLGVIAMEAAMGRMNHSSIPAAIGDQLMQFSPVAFLDPRNFFNRSDSDHPVGKTLFRAFIPTLLSPLADAYVFDEDFMGRQITGKNDFNDDKPEFQRVSYDTLPQLVSFSRWLNNISGGNDYKKGWININPSAAGYVASQYIGGPLQFVTKIGKTVAMITYEDLRDMRNVPFLSRFMTSTDNDYGRNQVSNAEFKYWSAIADDVRTQIRGFEKEIESGDTKNLDDYKKLVSSKEYEMYQMIDYMDWLKDIRELNQKRKEETTQDAQKQVTLEIYEVRRKMAECLNKAEEMGVYLDMSQLNLELANAKTTEERAAIQAKINEKRKENLKKIGAIE
jgi:site-specific DNA-cytosine methylase